MKSVLSLGVIFLSASAWASTYWFDTTAADRSASGLPIADRTAVTWTYAHVSAMEVCKMWGYETGLYTGNQSGELMGVNCFTADMTDWYDIPNSELYSTPGYGYGRSVTDPLSEQLYFWSSRAAYILCTDRGYATGFFTGHQDVNTGMTGVNCISSAYAHPVTVMSNDSRFGFPSGFAGSPGNWSWITANIAANNVCAYYGYQTGVLSNMYATGSAYYSELRFYCWN